MYLIFILLSQNHVKLNRIIIDSSCALRFQYAKKIYDFL